MSKPNDEYWRERRDEFLQQLTKDEADLSKRLSKVYASEAAKLDRMIAAYYAKYGEDKVIEYRRLLQSISAEDRTLLMERMDEFAKKYPQYADLMPVRESIYRLNELEAIQMQIRLQQLEIGAIEQEEFRRHFEEQARRAANIAAEELGFGKEFYRYDSEVVRATVGAAWAAGGDFSANIWANREKLASYLNDDFSKLIARGVSYDEISRELRQRLNHSGAKTAMRLVYTEGTYLFNEAQACVHESEFDSYALSCIHDGRACEVCRELEAYQKQHPAKFSERMPGTNFPPMHPWCRCSYTLEVADWDKWIDDYVAKRGGDSATHAMTLRSSAMVREPATTSLLESLQRAGSALAGLDFRLKGQQSLARKIRTDSHKLDVSEKEASDGINDVLRYTYVLPVESFADEFARIRQALEKAGYTVVKVKNTLGDASSAYRGVNTQFETPDGFKFELQFHTKQSLDVKERNHALYEEERLEDTPLEHKWELRREMADNAAKIKTPPNIEEVRK